MVKSWNKKIVDEFCVQFVMVLSSNLPLKYLNRKGKSGIKSQVIYGFYVFNLVTHFFISICTFLYFDSS